MSGDQHNARHTVGGLVNVSYCYLYPENNCELGTLITPILLMIKLKVTELKLHSIYSKATA